MARVSGPLFSMLASGRLEALVYDRRGFVRKFVPPTNPRTEDQGNVRQLLMTFQQAIGRFGPTTRAAVRGAIERMGLPGYRWNAYFLGMLADPEVVANYRSSLPIDPLTPDWVSAAQSAGIVPASLPYAGDPPLPAWFVLWMLVVTLYTIGAITSLSDPYDTWGSPGTADAWVTAIRS